MLGVAVERGSSPTAPPRALTTSRRSQSWCSAWSKLPPPGSCSPPTATGRDHLVIEAAYGLGEVVVGGQVEPDSYVLAKGGRVLHQHLGTKATRIVRGGDGRDQRVEVPAETDPARARRPGAGDALTPGGRIERHYGSPQDVEFAVDDQRIWIVIQPITTLADTTAEGGDRRAGTVRGVETARPQAWPPDLCASCAFPRRATGSSPARCWWHR